MTAWTSHLSSDPIPWLLENDNPSVQHLAFKKLLEIPSFHPEILASRHKIMNTGVIPKILAKQSRDGYWEKGEDFYVRSKYKGSVWSFILLAELLADPEDPRIQKACDFILEWSQDRKSGGFAYQGSRKEGGYHSGVLPCLTGNMTWCLIRFGRLDDSRVRRAINWITTYQRFDDRCSRAPEGWPYDRLEQCWGKHTCFSGVVKGLKACAEIPLRRRTKNIRVFIQNATEFLLKHRVYKRSHDLDRVVKPKWTKLGFPWMWDTDVLEMSLILTGLGIREERMRDAMELILSKQQEQGKWLLENSYNGRFQANIETKGKPSKWVTLNALRVLKGYYG
jgi:hypothetical protein